MITGALVAVMMTRAAPSWWSGLNADDAALRHAGQEIEHAVVRQLSAVRDPDPAPGDGWRSAPWAVSMDAADANAWLNTRLRLWLANQDRSFAWPSQVGQVQVRFEEGTVRIGMMVRAGGRDQVLSAALRPVLHADGSLWLPASTVQIGRLRLPASWFLDRAQHDPGAYMPRDLAAVPEVREMLRVFRGERPAVREAVIGVDEGRRVRLLGIQPRDGRVEITARTEGSKD